MQCTDPVPTLDIITKFNERYQYLAWMPHKKYFFAVNDAVIALYQLRVEPVVDTQLVGTLQNSEKKTEPIKVILVFPMTVRVQVSCPLLMPFRLWKDTLRKKRQMSGW